jgi:predicted acyl esterase
MSDDGIPDRMGLDWEISAREYDVVVERDVEIPVDGGDITLVADVFRPDTDEEVPAIIGAHPYNTEYQTAPIKPKSIGPQMAWIESGDPYYFPRRGYAHVILSLRGTGKSDGEFRNLDAREAQDVVDAMEWLSGRAWCTGEFGMFGVSYFAMIQKKVAELQPDRLEAVFAPWGISDYYRDWAYHGGILANEFTEEWRFHIDNPRAYSWTEDNRADEYDDLVEETISDPEIYAHDDLIDALEDTDDATDPMLVDMLLNDVDNEYWEERRIDHSKCEVPAYLGSGWGIYGLHLPGDMRSWREWQGPKKMLIGPDIYLDRPVYQLQPEAVRWFDYWIKGRDNGIMDEPPVEIFVMNSGGEWKEAEDWPVPDTEFQRFYLHDDELLFERDHWPNEGSTTYEDGPYRHESVEFVSPQLVEATEVVGPITLNFYAETTGDDALFIAELFDVDEDGNEEELTRGWLRGSMRKVDEERSEPWRVYHPYDEREPLEPGEIYEFNLNLKPTGNRFDPGHRIGLRLSSADVGGGWGGGDEVAWYQAISTGHVYRQSVDRITVHHNEDYPSNLLLPVTGGNRIGTYYSGGEATPRFGELPYNYIEMDKSVEE